MCIKIRSISLRVVLNSHTNDGFFFLENGGIGFLRNIHNHLPDYK